MTTKIPSIELGTIAVVGGLRSNAPLWRIEARARRVPPGRGNNDGNTPGSHGLRTTWMRSVPRNLVNGTVREYLDPVSEEAFISAQDERTSKVALEIAGVVLKGVLLDEQVAELSPFSPHPAANSEDIRLPPYLIAQGALRLEEGALAGLFEGKPKITGPVWLEPKGVVFTVEISQLAPQKPDRIPTFVRLQDAGNGQLMLELLDDAQPATGTGDTSWDKCLAQIRREFSSSTRRTAWLRVDLQLGSRLPRLSWSVSVTSDKKLKIDETVVRLPSGVAKIWLADQPIESQLLPPRRVLQLVPTAPQLKVGNDGVITLAWESKKGLKGISYEWNGSDERFAFDDLPMVHQPSEVLAQLRKLYSAGQQGENTTETAFVREQRGWLELPITVPENPPFLPEPVSSELTKLAAGGLLLGRRRSDLLRPNTIPSEVPWSIEVDVPRDFSFELKFDIRKPAELSLVQAQVTLAGSAVRMTGGLWIAGRRPDADDALPRVEPEPDAFIPLDMESCALESMDKAPFVMKRLAVTAPSLKGEIEWDHPSMRWERAPSLAPSSGIQIWPHRLDAKCKEVRGWFRHPTLPTIQTMPITRSDLTSTLPHASRGLDFFESKADQLLLVGIDGLQPRLDTQSRENFTKPTVTATSAALSLPGVEIERPTATTSLYSGHFSLPVCIEPHARAGVPAYDGAKEEVAAPVVTARDRKAFLELIQDRVRMGRLAAAGESLLFPPAAAHTKTNVVANSLAPPRKWDATALLDDVVRVAKELVSLGSISFEQGTTWKWTAAGDELLRGVYATANLGTQDKVTLLHSENGNWNVVGWSLAETADGSLGEKEPAVRDGHGIAWGTTLHRDGLVKRSLRQEHGKVAGELLSTSPSAPIQIDWPGEPNLRLAFTDLHVPISQKEWTASAQLASDTALGAGWTWSLFEEGKAGIRPLKLAPAFCFAPAALWRVTFDDARQSVVGCVFEGALGLGIESQPQPNDARARVRIVLEANGGGRLLVKNVESDSVLEWELRESLESFGTRSARLSAKPKWGVGQGLGLLDSKLAMRMLGSLMELEMAEDELDVLKIEQSVQTSAKLAVDSARVDLKTGRLVRLSLSVELREGVVVHATDDEGLDYATGSLDWFGNSIKFNNVIVDPVLRAFTFTRPAEVDVVVAPGVGTGKLETASVAFSTAGFGNGGFAIVALFAEVLVKGAFGPEVAASHLLLKDSGGEVRDKLRLDGRHKCKSAIPWPEVSVPELPAKAVSVEVEFGEGGRVSHSMDLHYSDHRIPGDHLGWKVGVPGILLKEAPKDGGKPAATWLIEASHSLEWTSAGSLGFTTAGSVQLWSASKLAAAIRTLGDKYTFTASYRGTDKPVPDFPEPGVRRVRLALAGLFDGEVAKALVALGEAWVIVGSGSFFVPREGDATLHLHVHLPFLHALSGDPAELEKSLAPKLEPGHTKQRLSRHDVLPTSLRLASDTVKPLGDFIEPLEDAVPFTASFAPEQALRGSQLERGFFFEKDKGVTTQLEACWHVEQFRREGASAAAKEPLFRFPRAAVMLARLHSWPVPKRPEVLSILVAHNAGKARTRVITVSTAHRQSLQSRVDLHYNTDLVVGSGKGVVRIPLVNPPGTTATDQRALLHFVLDHVSAPLFAVLRTFAAQRSHLAIELPRTKPPAVLAASFPQRAAKGFCVLDGRRTWPEPMVLPKDLNLGVLVEARSYEKDSSRLSVGVRGVVHPPRLATAAFQVGVNYGETVWLQQQDEVAFAVSDFNVEDAAPVGTAGTRLVRPIVPSTRALVDALLRMDPLLKDKLAQSLLPSSLSDIDRSDRVGAFSIARARALLGWAGVGESATAIAFAGPSAARWLRLPRPLPLPPNSGDDTSEWRRTVGWYGAPQTSCVVRVGRWAGLQGQPAKADSAPSWFLLVGCPEPQQVGSQASGPVWRGALRVRCTRINGEPNAAPVLLALLRKQATTANAALRCGTRRVAFTIVSLEGEWLTFKPAPDSSSTPIPPDAECTFELSLDVDVKDALPAGESGEVELKPVESCTLRPVSYHTISIKVTPPRARAYPLPLVVRSIFFDDPEYDLALSKVEPANAYVMASDGITRYQLWVDRRYVTPGETIVVRVDSVANSGSNLNPDSNPDTTFEMNLFARVKRWGASEFVKLNFRLGISFKESVVLKRGVMVSLPLSDLVDSNNAQGGTLAVGDLLQLQAFKGDLAVTLYFIVKTRSGLPTPEAMYSLIAFDPKAEERAPESPEDVAWTALHSSCPAAETLNAYQVDDGSELKLVRRGHFRWECTEAYGPDLKFALMKTHLPSESTHIPDQAEAERVQGTGMLWQLD